MTEEEVYGRKLTRPASLRVRLGWCPKHAYVRLIWRAGLWVCEMCELMDQERQRESNGD